MAVPGGEEEGPCLFSLRPAQRGEQRPTSAVRAALRPAGRRTLGSLGPSVSPGQRLAWQATASVLVTFAATRPILPTAGPAHQEAFHEDADQRRGDRGR